MPTILELAPCLKEPGFRLLAADQLLAVLNAIVDGTITTTSAAAAQAAAAATGQPNRSTGGGANND